jgi:hypothetical protein
VKNISIKLLVWEAEGLCMHEPTTFLCFDYIERPSDEIMLKLNKSSFMYGFFAGRACWYQVKSPEALAFVESLR